MRSLPGANKQVPMRAPWNAKGPAPSVQESTSLQESQSRSLTLVINFAALTRWRVFFSCTKVLDEMVDHCDIKSTLSQKVHGACISMQWNPLGPVEKVAPESPTCQRWWTSPSNLAEGGLWPRESFCRPLVSPQLLTEGQLSLNPTFEHRWGLYVIAR